MPAKTPLVHDKCDDANDADVEDVASGSEKLLAALRRAHPERDAACSEQPTPFARAVAGRAERITFSILAIIKHANVREWYHQIVSVLRDEIADIERLAAAERNLAE